MASLSVKKRTQNRVTNDVRKLVDEKINVLYEDFNDGKVNLLNTYKQTLENKLEKCLTLNEEISNIIEEDKDYDSEGDIAMEAELKIREYLENLKTFLSTKVSNPQLAQNRWKIRQFNQVKVPKFEIKLFSGNPVEWKTFNESFTAAVDKNISIFILKKMGYLMGFLKDDALNAVKGLLVINENYDWLSKC